MTAQGFLKLAVESIGSPRDVARLLLSANISREAVWTAFALVVAMNAFVYGLGLVVAPPVGALPVFLAQPIGYAVVECVSLAGMIVSITLVGRMMGGAGRLTDVGLLLVWVQALNILVQLASTVLMLAIPPLAGIVGVIAIAIGFWILLNFIDEAHGLGNMLKSFFVFVLALFALGIVLSVALTMAGMTPEGMMGNV
ncbi:YIP1 family protein [Sagittula sp. NFXS13]|uniref:YIP1 family protein n=1 Tax=Sagittula sp. NFXS13 TaxID=2819095 RepID=UPI0032DE4E01